VADRSAADVLAWAREQDVADPLRPLRERFYQQSGRIYLDGNSLGLLSRDAESALQQALREWRDLGIDGWMEAKRPWFTTAEELGALQAPLVGALPAEVVVTGTTTVNLHALAATFYHPSGRRTKILADELNFPSDIYALQSLLRLHGLDPAEHLILAPSRDGRTLDEEDLIQAMTDEVALVLLPGVLYRSGQLLDMERLAAAAQARSIPIGLDLCHSAGAVPHQLHDWGVDFAFWCGYKYLNGGPGAPAGLFVHQRHHGRTPALSGWFGVAKTRQFDMSLTFEPAPTAGAWQISTPSILASAPLWGALQLFHEAGGMAPLRERSLRLTDFLIEQAETHLLPLGFTIGTPLERSRRGGHVSLEHPAAVQITKALKHRQIIPDFRRPNVVRLAPVPLYNTFEEIWLTVQALVKIVTSGEHQTFSAERNPVA
jgi:kynureninase